MSNRVILGAFAGTHVLRISKPGHDVLQTLSRNELSFDSRWDKGAGRQIHTGSFSIDDDDTEEIRYARDWYPMIPLVVVRVRISSTSHMPVCFSNGNRGPRVQPLGDRFRFYKGRVPPIDGTRTVYWDVFEAP